MTKFEGVRACGRPHPDPLPVKDGEKGKKRCPFTRSVGSKATRRERRGPVRSDALHRRRERSEEQQRETVKVI